MALATLQENELFAVVFLSNVHRQQTGHSVAPGSGMVGE